jgi:hypothetical protein
VAAGGSVPAAVDDYRTNAGLAAVAFAVAAVAGFVYGSRADFVILGPLLLAVALAWAVQWIAAGRRSPSGGSTTAGAQATLARISWIAGVALAVVLAVAAVAAG